MGAIRYDNVTRRVTAQTWTSNANGPSSTQSFRILGLSIDPNWGDEDVYGGSNWTDADRAALVATRANFPDEVVAPGSIIPSEYNIDATALDATTLYVVFEVLS